MPPEAPPRSRPRLLLFVAPYDYSAKNVVAATLAWVAQRAQSSFEVYYDAIRLGRHLGSDPRDPGRPGDPVKLGLLTGGLVSGGRHLEALALSLLRFETTIVACGEVAFDGPLAILAADSGAEVLRLGHGGLVPLYDRVFKRFGISWPDSAMLVDREPSAGLRDIDAYLYPEIFYPARLGLETSVSGSELAEMSARGLRRIFVAGVAPTRVEALRGQGFEVVDTLLIGSGDDYAAVSERLAHRWASKRRGWILGDPTLVSYWLAAACREDRIAVYGIPQAGVLEKLADEFRSDADTAVLGRQFDDSDFFTLSALGQSFQVIDPGRPPLPVLTSLRNPWPAAAAAVEHPDPSDAQLRQWADEGRVLTSLVFWTGMIRETENLFALADLIAMTGLRAGFVVTTQSLAWRPSPLDLLHVPAERGGLFPLVELLLGSCGNGVAIESLLTPGQLTRHLTAAQAELDRLEVPPGLRPRGWWATMDAPMVPRGRRNAVRPIRLKRSAPFKVQVRFHRKGMGAMGPAGALHPQANGHARSLRRSLGDVIRRSQLDALFEAYRPYEHLAPGHLDPALARAVQSAGFDYMLTKSRFDEGPTIAYREGDFVALNYTAGQWDGWTPFETINNLDDLRRAEKRLLRRHEPGWLLGGIDSCLWTMSGELWDAAPRLRAIAEFAAAGGASGRLINVVPRVLARYARVIADRKSIRGADRNPKADRSEPAKPGEPLSRRRGHALRAK